MDTQGMTKHEILQTLGAPGDDLLEGSRAIAEFMYRDPKRYRTVQYLAKTSNLPVFRYGNRWCGLRSTLWAWIKNQENRGKKGPWTAVLSAYRAAVESPEGPR